MAKKNKKWKVKLTDEEAELYDAVYDFTYKMLHEKIPNFSERVLNFRPIILSQMNNMSMVEKFLGEDDQAALDYFRIKSGTDLEKLDSLAEVVKESYGGFYAEWVIASSVDGKAFPYPDIDKSPRRYFDYIFCFMYYYLKNYPFLYKRIGINPPSDEEKVKINNMTEKLCNMFIPYLGYLIGGTSILERQAIILIRQLGTPKT